MHRGRYSVKRQSGKPQQAPNKKPYPLCITFRGFSEHLGHNINWESAKVVLSSSGKEHAEELCLSNCYTLITLAGRLPKADLKQSSAVLTSLYVVERTKSSGPPVSYVVT